MDSSAEPPSPPPRYPASPRSPEPAPLLTSREYYDLAKDPHQLTDKLYRATPAQEQALGIPALAARLAADRVS
ncbi:hypothetical protein OHB11_34045 [Streptomyces zaomyceticus]|uniref:Uncharacterized protein n=1 Tax=Streptomyces zaomyceticus TaxID=68286 RepID=A0ABZ1LIL2_9ACTN